MTRRNPAQSVFFNEGDLSTRTLFEGVTTGLAWGEKLMFSLVTLEPGGEVPEHAHPHEQGGVCLEGEFELIVSGQVRTVQAGEMYIIPGDTPHAARALSKPCKTLDVFAPPRDDYKS